MIARGQGHGVLNRRWALGELWRRARPSAARGAKNNRLRNTSQQKVQRSEGPLSLKLFKNVKDSQRF